jgi:ABC-2 type transport system permease protein
MNAQMKTMTALVRRELWEHRGFWMVPAIMSALLTLLLMRVGFELLTEVPAEKIARINARLAEKGTLAGFMDQTHVAATAFTGIGLAIGSIMMFVAFFYLLDSLYGDRRDRSILFWRSMPVTDAQTVLSKLMTVGVAAPLAVIGVLTAAFVVWGSLGAAVGLAVGFDHWWIGLNPLAWFYAGAQLLGVVGGSLLILAPFVGWLLLASAWAPRAPFLWATLPFVGVGMLEEMVFDTEHFITTVFGHFQALFPKMFGHDFEGFGIRSDAHDSFRIAGGMDFSTAFLAEPRLWIGLAIGAGLVAAAIRIRRVRDDATY